MLMASDCDSWWGCHSIHDLDPLRGEISRLGPREAAIIAANYERTRHGEATDAERTVMTFGKYRGRMLGDIDCEDRSYLEWLADQKWMWDRNRHLTIQIRRVLRGW